MSFYKSIKPAVLDATVPDHGVPGCKCAIPDLSDTIIRKRLFSVMERHRRKSVVLVLGQAAQGKSTLVASYLKYVGERTAWLHLDRGDSDSTNLFHLLLNALYRTLGDGAILEGMKYSLATLGPRDDTSRQMEILTTLFQGTGERVNIVVDDMESLENDASSFDLLQGITEGLPGNIRLFLISRTMPPLGIQKLKMKKKLLVMGNEELAFTLGETHEFFSRKANPGTMPSSQIRKIHAITDGWAGGIALLADSMDHTLDPSTLPHKIRVETLDFFTEEVFSVQPGHIRKFLVTASFFDTIDPEILSKFSTAKNPLEGLLELERRNLFIHRLEQREGPPLFRFNKLFKNYLEEILRSETDDGQYRQLCRRAGKLLDQRGKPESAVKYYIKARAYDKTAEIIRKRGTDFVINGRFGDLAKWISSLPNETTWSDPWLIYYLTMTRRIRGGRCTIDDFQTALLLFREKNDTRGTLLCLAHLIESAVFLQEPPHMILDWIGQGEALLSSIREQPLYSYAKAVLWQQIGFGYIAGTGDVPRGISACRNARILADGINNSDLKLNAIIISVLGYTQAGELEEAEKALGEIDCFTCKAIHPEYRALKTLVDIELLLKKGALDRAETLLAVSEKDIEKFGLIFLYPGFVKAKALHRIYTGDYCGAEGLADRLSDLSVLAGNSFYRGLAHFIRGTSLYHRHALEPAEKEVTRAIEILVDAGRAGTHLHLARTLLGLILTHRKRFRRAREELDQALDHFTRFSSPLSKAEIFTALGLLMWEQNKLPQALYHIGQGIGLSEQEGYEHFILMGPGDFIRAFLLDAMFNRSNASTYLPSMICTRFSDLARRELVHLCSLKTMPPGSEYTRNIKAIFRQTLPNLRMETLGQFRVFEEGTRGRGIEWAGTKPKLLLKSIITHGAVDIPKDIIIEDLWPGSSFESGVKNFKVNLHRLRKALEPDAIKEFGYTYLKLENGFISLDCELVTLDIKAFSLFFAKGESHRHENNLEKAIYWYEKAADLYKGDFLSEDPYAEWAVPKRNSLRVSYLELLQKTATLYERTGQKERAVSAWKAVIQAEPLMECSYQRLMELYAGLGRLNAGLRIFSLCKEVINRELGTEPEAETVNIYNKIKSLKKSPSL